MSYSSICSPHQPPQPPSHCEPTTGGNCSNNPPPQSCPPPDCGSSHSPHGNFGGLISALNDSLNHNSVLNNADINVGDILSHNTVNASIGDPTVNVDLSHLANAVDIGHGVDASLDALSHSTNLFDTHVVDLGDVLGHVGHHS